eukprot:15454554-Alexandrium_andersonii.AAC.1
MTPEGRPDTRAEERDRERETQRGAGRIRTTLSDSKGDRTRLVQNQAGNTEMAKVQNPRRLCHELAPLLGILGLRDFRHLRGELLLESVLQGRDGHALHLDDGGLPDRREVGLRLGHIGLGHQRLRLAEDVVPRGDPSTLVVFVEVGCQGDGMVGSTAMAFWGLSLDTASLTSSNKTPTQ